MGRELNKNEQAGRQQLKRDKPRVYEKVIRFEEKYEKGESIALIQLQYHYACNMKCEHCAIETYQKNASSKRRMTPADVGRLADQADALGLARFVISGGEPTVFKDLEEIVKAIGPERFFINCDTNGWLLEEKAEYLKKIGVDRIQLSIDSLDAEEHDAFRRMPGAFDRAMKGIKKCQSIGLPLYIQTVVTKERLHSEEFINFVKYFNDMDLNVYVSFAKPVGAWEGHFENLIDREDLAYMQELEGKYRVCSHLTPGYGLDMGCIAVKGFLTVTEYGDVQPCPFMHVSLGNIYETPLKDIIDTGMNISYFGEHVDTCLMAEDLPFLKKYVEGRIYGRPVPVPCSEVFQKEDATKQPYWKGEINL
ncbi:radical SAM/SPASM domain-containing protein [Hungatella hathewayi]|uniref:radical SAM/SPASM domain-containing protein n=1 Tax=Hungatella hathewayi TaxID=154046 RepID=UPI003568CDBC